MWKTKAREFLLNVLMLLCTLAAMEVILRLSGYTPLPEAGRSVKRTVTIRQDDKMGWSMLPGIYRMVPADIPDSDPITFTVYSDGSRATRPSPEHSGPVVALLGGSFVQGHGLSDEQTLAWKVQQALPELNIRNHGVAAFGTVQALAMLERLGEVEEKRPAHYIYAFCDFHESRNVLDPGNLRAISLYSSSGMVPMPYADLDSDHRLVRYDPQALPQAPLRSRLSLARLVEDAYVYPATWKRRLRAREITQALIVEMKNAAIQRGADFSVLLLDVDPAVRREYLKTLEESKVNVLDCVDQRYEDRMFRLPNDPHPNEMMTDIWAACVVRQLNTQSNSDQS